MRFGILVSHLRTEEKLILEAARKRGVDVVTIFDRQAVLNLTAHSADASGLAADVVLDRSVVHSRAYYVLHALSLWGIPTLNNAAAAALCDDKALCTHALERAGVPTPRTMVAFGVESALEACERIGYPAVIKPTTGSWGRLLSKVNGPEQARSIFETKLEMGSFHHAIFYVQEYAEKPGRDIRAYVVGERVLAASYRSAEHWITNAARGAVSAACPVTPEIEEIALRAASAVGARLAGVDLMETDSGLQVIEVNTGAEFKGLMTTTNVDIAAEIVNEAISLARA